MTDIFPASSNAAAAVEKHKSGASCSQAILLTYAPKVGLSSETACKLATGLSGGLSCAEVCGALAAATCVLSLKHGAAAPDDKNAKTKTQMLVRDLQARFAARHGFLRCRDLLGCDIATPEGLQTAQSKNLFRTLCPQLVATSAEALDALL